MGRQSEVSIGRDACALCGDLPDVLAHRGGCKDSPGICEPCARWAVKRFDEGREEIEKFRADREEREG